MTTQLKLKVEKQHHTLNFYETIVFLLKTDTKVTR